MTRRRPNEVSGDGFALRGFDAAAQRAEKSLYTAKDALGDVARASDEYARRKALVDVLEWLMDASYALGLAEGHLRHAGRKDPFKVPRYRQIAELFADTWEGAGMRRVANPTDRSRAALAAGTTAAAGAILGGVFFGLPGAIAGSVAGGGLGPYAFMRWTRDPDDLGDAVLGGGVGGLFTPLGAAAGAYLAGDELARAPNRGRRRNPMATANEMRDAIEKWLKKEDLWSRSGMGFWTPGKWNEMGWGSRLDTGFVVYAEGTAFNHALAYGDLPGDAKIYQQWEKLLQDNGWWWEAMTVFAFHVYPAASELTRTSNPPRRINGWIGPVAALDHYLGVVGADRDRDGRFLIGGDPPIYGMGGDEVVLSDGTVYYAGGRPVPLAGALAQTSSGLPVRVFNPSRRLNMDPNAVVARLNAAIGDEDWEDAEDAWEDLVEWIARGGFWPQKIVELSDDDAYEWMEKGNFDEGELAMVRAFNREVLTQPKRELRL